MIKYAVFPLVRKNVRVERHDWIYLFKIYFSDKLLVPCIAIFYNLCLDFLFLIFCIKPDILT